MKISKFLALLSIPICLALGCKKDQFNDTSLVNTAAPASNVSVMFNITHDNTGLVTITPNGSGVVKYDVYYGDATVSPATVPSGQSTLHTYAEGTYNVKVIAHDLVGGTVTVTQQLVVSFLAPQNLVAKVTTNNLTVSVSATAKYATLFKVYFGDSTNVSPIPSVSILAGVTVNHNYVNAGKYIVKVIALSGGAATTQYLDTINVSKQIALPVNFEDPNTNYTMSDFGGNVSTFAVDPKVSTNHVMKSVKTAGAQTWAGTTIGTAAGFATPVPLTAANLKMTVRVLSPAAGLDVKLKLDNHSNPNNGLSVETDVKTTLVNQWETLTFDFSKPATGTPAWTAANTYDLASIFFDFNNAGTGATFYFDDLMMAPPSLTQIDLPVNFEATTVDYTMSDFGGNSTVIGKDPTNSSNHVMISTKTSGAQTWAGTTIGTTNGFLHAIPLTANATKMTLRVYSPAVGLDVKLKLDNHANPNNGLSVETDVKTTVANKWEMLTFDFTQNAAGTPALNLANKYDLASVFFDFNNAGTGSVFYWDELHFLSQMSLPVNFNNPDVDYTVTDFGSNYSSLVSDPANSGTLVTKTTKPAGAQTWAGTTMGTPVGFATAIPISSTRTKMTLQVYSPSAGIPIMVKLEDLNSTTFVQTQVNSTVANQWETLTFDFSAPSAGSYTAGVKYVKASVFFDFNNAGSGKVFYWNNAIFL